MTPLSALLHIRDIIDTSTSLNRDPKDVQKQISDVVDQILDDVEVKVALHARTHKRLPGMLPHHLRCIQLNSLDQRCTRDCQHKGSHVFD